MGFTIVFFQTVFDNYTLDPIFIDLMTKSRTPEFKGYKGELSEDGMIFASWITYIRDVRVSETPIITP